MSHPLPIVEIFGPTYEGEGPLVGAPILYVRVAYCDFECAWCDSMHAVKPSMNDQTVEKLELTEIHSRLLHESAGWNVGWVSISGGNPALYPQFEDLFFDEGCQWPWKIKVETQGSFWKPWLSKVDLLVISPKLASSDWSQVSHHLRRDAHKRFMRAVRDSGVRYALKFVIENDADLEELELYLTDESFGARESVEPIYLSVASFPSDSPQDLSWNYRWVLQE